MPSSHFFPLNKTLCGFLAAIIALFGAYFLSINLYGLNKGFGIGDEAYYLLSYKMAAEAYYPHFSNTPHVVAYFFERLNPGLIGYRVIHLMLNLISIGFFTFAVIRYLRSIGLELSKTQHLLLYLLGLYGATFVFQTSITTLSYNHLNEFFVLTSEALLLLGIANRNEKWKLVGLVALSGFVAAFDLYIKPTSFATIMLMNPLFLLISMQERRHSGRYVGWFFVGVILSIGFSFISYYSPAHWGEYLAFIRGHRTHTPYKVVSSFVSSGWDMLRSVEKIVVSGLALMVWMEYAARVKGDSRIIKSVISTALLAVNVFFAVEFFFPAIASKPFDAPWWHLWVYTSATFILVLSINILMAFCIIWKRRPTHSKSLGLLLLLLAINPMAMSIGTVNGFGQVQIHVTSWLLLNGIILFIFFASARVPVRIYASALVTVFLVVGLACFYRQVLPNNINGHSGLRDQKHLLQGFPQLENVHVDKPTYDLLTQTKAILDAYPNLPTVSFFDAPGLQYAFGRPWIVQDPWLSNYEQPYTKDDDYNCRAITGYPNKLRQSVFIVSHKKGISDDLNNCLSKVGYPHGMKLLGTVSTTVGGMTQPLEIYLHP